MLDIQLLRSNTAAVAERLARRGYDFDTARFDALEERRKSVQVKPKNYKPRATAFQTNRRTERSGQT